MGFGLVHGLLCPSVRRAERVASDTAMQAETAEVVLTRFLRDLHEAGCRADFSIRDPDGKCPALFDAILADTAITVVLSGVRMPRMNAIMDRWWTRPAPTNCSTAPWSGTNHTCCTRYASTKDIQ
jgi:hypothetical protein